MDDETEAAERRRAFSRGRKPAVEREIEPGAAERRQGQFESFVSGHGFSRAEMKLFDFFAGVSPQEQAAERRPTRLTRELRKGTDAMPKTSPDSCHVTPYSLQGYE